MRLVRGFLARLLRLGGARRHPTVISRLAALEALLGCRLALGHEPTMREYDRWRERA